MTGYSVPTMASKSKTKNQKSIVLGVTGSIAAYKSAELASLLVKQNHNVFLVMTNDATEFITPLTLQTLSKNPVMTNFFDEKENWRPGHIDRKSTRLNSSHLGISYAVICLNKKK